MIIHPGFLKTATTTLQTSLFARHPDLFFLGPGCAIPAYSEFVTSLRAIDGVNHDSNRLNGLMNEALATRSGTARVVLSDETLTANVYLLEPIARRLANRFPDARILFTIRNQVDAVCSFYARHGRVLTDAPAPYSDRHISFENWLDHAFERLPQSMLSAFDYGRTIAIYERYFGADRISVLLQENLAARSQIFSNSLAGLLEIDPTSVRDHLADRRAHTREDAHFVRYDRFMKRFPRARRLRESLPRLGRVTSAARALVGRRPEKTVLPAKWSSPFARLFGPQNQRLSSRYELPLEQHDYPFRSQSSSATDHKAPS